MKASLLGAALIALVLAGVAREAVVAPAPVPAWVAPTPFGADDIANIYVAMLARMTNADRREATTQTMPLVLTRAIRQACTMPGSCDKNRRQLTREDQVRWRRVNRVLLRAIGDDVPLEIDRLGRGHCG